MSNQVNTELLEQAAELCEYWTGTMWERLIGQDVKANDLEALRYHLAQANKERAIQEDQVLV